MTHYYNCFFFAVQVHTFYVNGALIAATLQLLLWSYLFSAKAVALLILAFYAYYLTILYISENQCCSGTKRFESPALVSMEFNEVKLDVQ